MKTNQRSAVILLALGIVVFVLGLIEPASSHPAASNASFYLAAGAAGIFGGLLLLFFQSGNS